MLSGWFEPSEYTIGSDTSTTLNRRGSIARAGVL